MDNMLIYLLKVSAGTALLYLAYLLLFRKDTFYRRNRVLLLLTLLLPLFFPFIKIPVLSNDTLPADPVTAIGNTFYFENQIAATASTTVNSFDYNKLLIWIYLIFSSLLLLRIIVSLISTFSIIKKGSVKSNKFPRVIISDNQIPPFSFFPYAVIPVEEYKGGNYDDILDHEFAHIRQGHTFDLLLSELFIAFQWFNPFVWFLKRSVILNHEYLADNVSIKNKSLKEYQYRLLNFQSGLKKISLAHSFNSLIKNRIIMINKKPTPRKATLKNIMILPVVVFVVYAFATPEYHYSEAIVSDSPLTIYETPAVIQKEVKGIVLDEAGKPLSNVNIFTTGTMGNASAAETGKDGRFSFPNLRDDAIISFTCNGFKRVSVKADFSKEMVVKMVKEAISGESKPDPNQVVNFDPRPNPLVVVDGVISEKSMSEVAKELGYNRGISKFIMGKEATDKYLEKGANGVYEITTRKKALEMGLKPPFPRLAPDDYPTFQGQQYLKFSKWVSENAKYPAEAQEKRIEGWGTVNFKVELDGSVNIVASPLGAGDPIIVNEIIRAIQNAPKWDSPKNVNVDEPFTSSITLKFKLPDQILDEAPFVVVQEMPQFPGGDKELLDFLANNTKYPESLRSEKIEGRVIVRFVVNTEGKVEGCSVLKGVHPLLDAEAVRVITSLPAFNPGKQAGKPVNVWYMAPVTFSLAKKEPLFSNASTTEILKFMGANTGYPQEARVRSDTGKIFIIVKLEKGGIIREVKAVTEETEITIPLLPEIVIVGYKTSAGAPLSQNAKADEILLMKQVKGNSKDHLLLKAEAERVAANLGSLNIPEWKDKDMEFAIPMKFFLK